MVKEYVKRYLALYLHKRLSARELVGAIEKGLKDYFGALYPTKILQVKFVGHIGDIALVSFHIKDLNPHLLIPLMSLIRVNDEWVVPLLTSGTVRSLRESLKERYPELVKG